MRRLIQGLLRSSANLANRPSAQLAAAQITPPEVLEQIFERFHMPQDRSTLASCTLVCRSWNAPSTWVLLRRLTLPVISHTKSGLGRRKTIFLRFEDIFARVRCSPRLAASLRHLYIRHGGMEITELWRGLIQLDSLRDFTLVDASVYHTKRPLVRGRYLELDHVTLDSGRHTGTAFILNALVLFERISTLTLFRVGQGLCDMDIMPDSTLSVDTLELNSGIAGYWPTLQSWIAPGSVKNLRLIYSESSPLMDTILWGQREGLRSCDIMVNVGDPKNFSSVPGPPRDVRPVRLSSMVQCSHLDSLSLKFNFALRTIAVSECCVTWQQWISIPIPPLRKLFIQINTVESVFWRGREHAMPVRDHDEHHRRVMQLIASMDWTQLEACVQQSPDLLRVDLMLCVDSAFFRRGWCRLPAGESAEISGRTGPSDFMQEAIRSKLSRRTRAMIHFVEPDNESHQSYQMYLDSRSSRLIYDY